MLSARPLAYPGRSLRRNLLLLAGLLACNPDGPGEPTSGTSTSSATSTSGVPTTTDDDATTTTTTGTSATSTTSGDTSTGSSSGDPSTGAAERCGDGIVDPGDLCFDPPRELESGATPVAIDQGDLDGDGLPDLAVADFFTQSIYIHFGAGGGEFTAGPTLPSFLEPRGLILAEFNNDDALDLAVADIGIDLVGIYLNDPGKPGMLGNPTPTSAGEGPRAFAAADLDDDGLVDLVVANEASNDLSLLLADTPGTFADPVSLPVGASPYDLVLADFNEDGRLDLASADQDLASVSVLLATGPGEFGPLTHFAVGPAPRSITAGDIDGDGHAEIVTASYTTTDLSILRGLGDGTFMPKPVLLPIGEGLYTVVLADLDHDGNVDVVGVHRDLGHIQVARNLGPDKIPFIDAFQVGAGPLDLVVTDLDGDGALDVATADSVAGTVTILRANP